MPYQCRGYRAQATNRQLASSEYDVGGRRSEPTITSTWLDQLSVVTRTPISYGLDIGQHLLLHSDNIDN